MTITLATLPEATEQQVFDQVKNHLLSQMKKSMGISDCAYKSPEGLMCAAGCLIADDEYDDDMEDVSWDDLANSREVVPFAHMCLICTLQRIHDFSSVEEWEEKLKALALERNLNWD